MNLPNILTTLRVIMIPFLVLCFMTGNISDWITLAIFIAASLTDWLDGYLARKQNLVTDFGKLMDPLADKLMVMAALVCFTADGILHPAITILVLAREFLVTGLRMIATTKNKVIAADIWGKLKTGFQDAAIIAVLIRCATGAAQKSFVGATAEVLVWIMAGLTVISAVNYCIKNRDIFKKEI